MAKVLYSAAVSLDGFIAGPGGDMSWLSEYVGGENPTAERLLADTGALLIGNRTFTGDDPNRGTDSEGAFGGQYDGPAVVLTHRPPGEAPEGVVFSGDLHDAVAQAKEAAGERYVNVLGADVARQCLEAGLLDEILMFFVPVLLGAGIRSTTRRTGIGSRAEHVDGPSTLRWPDRSPSHGAVALRAYRDEDVAMVMDLATDPYVALIGTRPASPSPSRTPNQGRPSAGSGSGCGTGSRGGPRWATPSPRWPAAGESPPTRCAP